MKRSLSTVFRSWLSFLPLFFPLYLVRFDVFGLPTTLLEIVVGFALLVAAIFWLRPFKVVAWIREQLNVGWRSPFWPLLLLGGAATVSLLIVPSQRIDITGETIETFRLAAGVWKGWIVMPALYFLMVWSVPKDRGWWMRSRWALGLSGAGLSLWALFQMVTGAYLTTDGRASGPFESANYLALYLGPVVVLGLISLVRSWKERRRADFCLWIFLTVPMAVALWGTASYAAFIAVAAGLAFYFLLSPDFSWRQKRGAVLAGFLLGTLLLLNQINTPKFTQFLDFEGRSSSSVRLEVYEIAWALFSKSPVWGIGLGQFQIQYRLSAPRILEHFPYEWVMLHPHNLYLAWGLNLGFLGLTAMVWMSGLVFVQRFSVMVPKGFKRWIAFLTTRFRFLMRHEIAAAMLVVILVHGLFDTPFFKNDLAYLWWWVVAMGI